MNEEELLKPKTFRDTISTVEKKTGKRNWIYALKPKGKLYQYRNLLAYVYLIVFFGLPFIKIDGHPLILINVVESKFILFGKIFWPQDFFIFAVGMIAFILFIVLFTVVFGRLFCGWVCPQTIFMEFYFRKIEWLIEGTPSQQKKLNAAPWTGVKVFKKTLKHFLYLLFSFLIAHTFLSYIIGVDELRRLMGEGIMENFGLFAGLVFFTLLFYGVFAFIREIVCTTICPYGRLQGVMFDKNTLLVGYDYNRGEPRGFIKKNDTNEKPLGDCIDCKKCVQVCPTGIDIRDGVQLDCVNCTACIDACDEVMLKIGRAPELIKFTSENLLEKNEKYKINFRAKAYCVLLLAVIGLLVAIIMNNKNIEIKVNRAKGQTFTQQDANIINIYDAKILNKTNFDLKNVTIAVDDLAEATLQVIGTDKHSAKKQGITTNTIMISMPAKSITKRSKDIVFVLKVDGKVIDKSTSKFLGPF
jgi:cytochrome c oxidase accessory protein FixG